MGNQSTTPTGGGADLRDRLRRALPQAIKTRDGVAVAALRSALAAIENAEAADATRAPPAGVHHPMLAGTVPGLGAGEVPRRSLPDREVERIVRGEVAERLEAALGYERMGRAEQAARLRREADVLGSYLDGPGASPPQGAERSSSSGRDATAEGR